VVEELIPCQAGKILTEVRTMLAHDRFEVDHGGALGCHCHVLGRGRESDDGWCGTVHAPLVERINGTPTIVALPLVGRKAD